MKEWTRERTQELRYLAQFAGEYTQGFILDAADAIDAYQAALAGVRNVGAIPELINFCRNMLRAGSATEADIVGAGCLIDKLSALDAEPEETNER